jgi:hypothetical protein
MANTTYEDIILPIMASIEAIATKGKSPGTAAMAQREAIMSGRNAELDRQEKQRIAEETRRQNALKEKALGFELQDAEQKNTEAKINSARKTALERRISDYTQRMKAASTPEDSTMLNKEYADLDMVKELVKEERAHQRALELENLKQKGAKDKSNPIVGYDDNGEPVLKAQGKQLSQNTAKTIAELKNFPNLLNSLRSDIKVSGDVMGPWEGRWQTAKAKAGIVDEKTKKASKLNARYEAVKQVVAKGMEGGVLRKEDMPKYEAILGSIKLSPEFASQALDQLEEMMTDSYNTTLNSYRATGYAVPNSLNLEKQEPKKSNVFASEEEAIKSGVKGEVIINGKKAVID